MSQIRIWDTVRGLTCVRVTRQLGGNGGDGGQTRREGGQDVSDGRLEGGQGQTGDLRARCVPCRRLERGSAGEKVERGCDCDEKGGL